MRASGPEKPQLRIYRNDQPSFAKSSDFTEIWRNTYQMFRQIKYFYLVLAKHLTTYASHRKKKKEVAELEHMNAYSGAVTNQITMDALFE